MTETNQHNGHGTEDQQPGVGKTGAKFIAQPANKQPGKYCNGNGSNHDIAHLAFGEMELLPDDGHERSDAKPSKKTNKEGHPCDVESPHMRCFKT